MQYILRSHKIYWDLTRSIEISKDLLIWHLTFDMTEVTDSTSTDTDDIGTILSHFHWWILWLSQQSDFDYSVSRSVDRNLDLRDASASKKNFSDDSPNFTLPRTSCASLSEPFPEWVRSEGKIAPTSLFRIWRTWRCPQAYLQPANTHIIWIWGTWLYPRVGRSLPTACPSSLSWSLFHCAIKWAL